VDKLYKKIAFLVLVVLLALGFDGTLTYDIFDLSTNTFSKVLGYVLLALIIGGIAWAEATKKDQK